MNNFESSIFFNNKLAIKNEKGFFNLDKDRESVEYYEKFIAESMGTKLLGVARIEWLIENDFYVSNLLKGYKRSDVERLIETIYDYKFQFKSFMAISKFYNNYALKTDDRKKYLEKYEDRIIACALFLAQGVFELAKRFAIAMIEQRYQPATPTFLNSGKKRGGELVSCFLLEMDDSLNAINYGISTSMQLSKVGGGVALNLSKLRARGSPIKGISGSASGVLPVLKILENVFDYVDQLGQRPGAGAAYLNIFHLDLLEFLDCKKVNSDEKSRIQTLSLGLLVPSKFFEIAGKNQDMYLFDPYSVFANYKKHLNDMDLNKYYDQLVENPDVIKKKIKSRNLLNNIAKVQFESGYPYLIFLDNANNTHPLKGLGRITMSNLCTEIFQLQETSIIRDYGQKDDIKYDVSCVLGSLNINSMFEFKNIQESVDCATRALSKICVLSDIANAPGISKANKDLRSIGLGVMNYAGFLYKNQIHYDSDLSLEFADVLFSTINYYSILSSCEIAKEEKSKFVGFEKSEYANGNYFDKYLSNSYLPKTDKIKSLFEGLDIPTTDDWQKLKIKVQKYGLYNAYRLAIAPTQSISYIQNATSSIQPVVDMVETRVYGDSSTYFPAPFLTESNVFFYKSAYLLDQKKLIDLVAVVQDHIDQGISTVIYVTNHTSTKELVRLYTYAHHKKLKSLYYTRTKNLEVEECLSCAV